MMIEDMLYVWRDEILACGFQPGKLFVLFRLTEVWVSVFDIGSSDRAVQLVHFLWGRVEGVDEPLVKIRHLGPFLFEKP